MKLLKLLFSTASIFSIALLFSGCEEKSKTDVGEVHWDRDMCARCVMVVSDRHNTVQVRDVSTGKKYMFDDIGCTLQWFKDQNIQWKDTAKIWITDVATGKWIDARTAFYNTENITPMGYGFSAHKEKSTIQKDQEIIDFNEVVKRAVK